MNEDILLLKSLADESRLKIIEFLLDGEKCVCQIIPELDVKQSTTSSHLGKLEKAGIISSRRDGKKIFYKIINKKVISIIKTLGCSKCGKVLYCTCQK